MSVVTAFPKSGTRAAERAAPGNTVLALSLIHI